MLKKLLCIGVVFWLSGCVVAPPYASNPYYGGDYYAPSPAYIAAPSVDIGFGYWGGHGWGGRGWGGWHSR